VQQSSDSRSYHDLNENKDTNSSGGYAQAMICNRNVISFGGWVLDVHGRVSIGGVCGGYYSCTALSMDTGAECPFLPIVAINFTSASTTVLRIVTAIETS